MPEDISGKEAEPKPATPNADVMRAELEALRDRFLDPSKEEREGISFASYPSKQGNEVELEQERGVDGTSLSAVVRDPSGEDIARVQVALTGKVEQTYRLQNVEVAQEVDLETASSDELDKLGDMLQPVEAKQ